MANKVIICGIDTSTLPKCNNEKLTELMNEIKSGNQDAREEFIMYNLRLVLSIVQRFSINQNSVDDIFQVGIIGLLKSIDNFDTSVGVKFSTYAVPMIIGEIRKFLRDSSTIKVTRSIRDVAYKALQAKEQLLKTTNKEATIEEISKEIDIPEKQIAEALDAISEPLSLYDTIFHDNGDTMLIMDQIKDDLNDDKILERTALKQALSSLGKREQQILFLRYYVGKTQMEISDTIGISQAQVSRLEKDALKEIKASVT
ncbi:MAG: sigma-70 family RNA polymerase sigma factor [Clostridia bacterium]|nr:sigma-70 family RNA polymerase sigma factor [Clostridia bacterium]